VMGNPPYAGKKEQDVEQKRDMENVWNGVKGAGVLDYVSAWYAKAARYIAGTRIRVGFVSTNSITQGEQVAIMWGDLLHRWQIAIHFAHRTFEWASEARGKAHVHVVIIGFANYPISKCTLFDYEGARGEGTRVEVSRINPYLVEAADILLQSSRSPLNGAPEITYGSFALDDGNYTLSPDDKHELVQKCPRAAQYIRPFIGGRELIHGEERYCLWLADVDPAHLRTMPEVLARVEAVQQWRASRGRETTVDLAATPTLFAEVRQPSTDYLAFPTLSSVRRRYIPIAFLPPSVIASNQIYVVAGAGEWTFGILNSGMHMAWVRNVAGRFKSDFRYSAGIVYNNFPWPNSTPEQRKRVEEKARAVLTARQSQLPPRGMSTLADLYDPLTMPPALAQAHVELDRVVELCYRRDPFKSDRERVEHLFRLYEELTAPLLPVTKKRRRRRGDRPETSTVLGSKTPPLIRIEDEPAVEEGSPEEEVGTQANNEPAPWYEVALQSIQDGLTDDGTDKIAETLEQMISSNRIEECNHDLGIIADREAEFPLDALITILTFTQACKNQLPNRQRLREATRLRLSAVGKNASSILRHI
jgi:hypothetical protein